MITVNKSSIRTWSMLGANGAFGIATLELPSLDPNIAILTSDLTYFSGLERFQKNHPDKFYNLGIAEQNTVGVAAGMAKEGLNVFVANYATFITTRSCDQLRVNMGYMKLGIKLVGCAAGFSIGVLGPTHLAIEDIAITRAIPNITILSPADGLETIKCTLAAAQHEGPVYIRLTGGMNFPVVYTDDYAFKIGRAVQLRQGLDVAIIATGSMVHHALEAEKLLGEAGIDCSVLNMHTIKPIDRDALAETMRSKLIVTIEEHNVIGGLGSAVAEYLAAFPNTPPQLILGIQDKFDKAGSYDYLLEQNGLTGSQISDAIYKFLYR